jgi:leucyl-tRNA synthetase
MAAVSPYDGEGSLPATLKGLHRKTHDTIRRVTRDIEDRYHFNTAISAVMELMNDTSQMLNQDVEKTPEFWPVIREAVEAAIILLSPVVPHITDELWHMLGKAESLIEIQWPSYDEAALTVEQMLIVLQVNGKVRSKIQVPASFEDKDLEKAALEDERVKKFIDGKPVKKIIVVKKKLVNVVV